MNLKERAARLKTDIPAVALVLRRPETPPLAKLFASAAVIYALSPVDIIPDFIPVLGFLDDVLILPTLISAAIHFIPPDVLAACRAEAAAPRRHWYYGLPALAFWLVLLAVLLHAIC